MHQYDFCLADSLDKIFPGKPPKKRDHPLCAGSFAGERTSFQIAYTVEYDESHMLEEDLHFEIHSHPGISS
ncbi:hypothetical protein K040078D81_04030 [Blautia hominis]|uniref:Uncharacterized protein n=1 Tax=Blautia hominis TaxID=2025493 RepID=A0ABQ0B4B1_9FIRM